MSFERPRHYAENVLNAMRNAMKQVPEEMRPTVIIYVSQKLNKAAIKHQGAAMLETKTEEQNQ